MTPAGDAVSRVIASLRFRLLVGLVCVFALGGLAMLGLMRADALSAHEAIEEKSLATQAKELIAGLRLDAGGRLVRLRIPKAWRSAYRTPGAAYFTLCDPAGRVVAQDLPAPTRVADHAPVQVGRVYGQRGAGGSGVADFNAKDGSHLVCRFRYERGQASGSGLCESDKGRTFSLQID